MLGGQLLGYAWTCRVGVVVASLVAAWGSFAPASAGATVLSPVASFSGASWVAADQPQPGSPVLIRAADGDASILYSATPPRSPSKSASRRCLRRRPSHRTDDSKCGRGTHATVTGGLRRIRTKYACSIHPTAAGRQQASTCRGATRDRKLTRSPAHHLGALRCWWRHSTSGVAPPRPLRPTGGRCCRRRRCQRISGSRECRDVLPGAARRGAQRRIRRSLS